MLGIDLNAPAARPFPPAMLAQTHGNKGDGEKAIICFAYVQTGGRRQDCFWHACVVDLHNDLDK